METSMTIQIVLPEDASTIKSTQKSILRHGGDEILGHLEVITFGSFEFDIEVTFEGIVRTWIGSENDCVNSCHLPPTSELQFLKETQQLFSGSTTSFDRGYLNVQHLPFRFVIPLELISPHSNVHSDFLKPCPSAKLGSAFWSATGTKTYRQPAITYVIKITRIRTGIPLLIPVKCNFEREIIVIPYTNAAPPLQMEHYPRDYLSSTVTTMRQQIWGRPLGVLKVSAAEPSPLNIWTSAPRLSSTTTLRLTFSPLYQWEFGVSPQEWKYIVSYHLRSRTFYSTRPLDGIPTIVDVKRNPFLQVRVEKIRSEVREIGKISWRRDCETQSPEGDVSHNKECWCVWKTNLAIPISATKNLLPTFLNQLSVRQYVLVLQLSIKGLYHGLMELVLPVQVIYCPANTIPGLVEESNVETQDEILSSVPHYPHHLASPDVNRQYCPFQAHDTSPPSYD